jgi:protein CpxP
MDSCSDWSPAQTIPRKKKTCPERKRTNMTPDELNNVAVELKRLGSELNLSDHQKEELKTFLTEKYEKLQEYRKQNPNISKEDIAQYVAKNRTAGREKIEKFLTPEQLTKWDAEVAKAKDFLSQRAASA